jgi:hypothetical protein
MPSNQFLKHLDVQINASYPLIVVTDHFGIRGLDYRSSVGITMIINASFETQRDLF